MKRRPFLAPYFRALYRVVSVSVASLMTAHRLAYNADSQVSCPCFQTASSELDRNGILDWDEVFVDASLFPGNERRLGVGRIRWRKGSKCLVSVDGQRGLLGSHSDGASPAEITLLDRVIAEIRVPRRGPGRPRTRPLRMIDDRACDSDPLHKRLRIRAQ